MKEFIAAILTLISGLLLLGAAFDPGLPEGYWHHPQAGGAPPHDWSDLERDLQPTACGQCHIGQFEAWRQSLHAHAYSPGLIGQFPDLGHAEANDCLKCHAPLAEQRYRNDADMRASLTLALKQADAADGATAPLRHAGVTCAACHVRGFQRFGPPPGPTLAVGRQPGPAHGGFTATRAFEQSQFCASCHQFPQSMAVNGKPLENTLAEWRASRFAREGVTCQVCHMPDRRHEFKGIHDPAMVRKGLAIKAERLSDGARLTLASQWIGHAFPTYVTPRVIVRADAVDAGGKVLRAWQWEIVREVEYDNGWREKRDTRLMPGEQRTFVAAPAPKAAASLRFTVRVEPDHFYKGVYHSLLTGGMDALGESLIRRAAGRAAASDYLLFEQRIKLSP